MITARYWRECNKPLHFLILLDSLTDDKNHTSQVGTQLYMSPEQVIIEDILVFARVKLLTSSILACNVL